MRPHIITREDFKDFTASAVVAASSGRKRMTVNVDVLSDKITYILTSEGQSQEINTFDEAIELYNKA